MAAKFIQTGDSVDYTPSVDVPAGEVIQQEDLIGIAKRDIPTGTLGALAVTGIFDIPKITGPGENFPAGIVVYWDNTAKQVDKAPAAGNKILGKVIAAAGENDETARVRLLQ